MQDGSDDERLDDEQPLQGVIGGAQRDGHDGGSSRSTGSDAAITR